LLEELLHFDKPVVARVNGHALGGGLGLVAACTFAIAAEDAELGTPEMNVGLFPMMILPLLARHVPRRRLVRMVLLGERLPAAEAYALGLVDEVVSRGELDVATERWVHALSTKSSSSLAAGLRAFSYLENARMSEDLRWLEARFVELLGTADAQEGLLAFAEKRPPVWSVPYGDSGSAKGNASGGGR
jgi:enoyl-CoA hydratase/carnithine racemase